MSDDREVKVTIRLPASVRRRVRVLAAMRETSMERLLVELITDSLARAEDQPPAR
jgi:predicted transcriptional regulator